MLYSSRTWENQVTWTVIFLFCWGSYCIFSGSHLSSFFISFCFILFYFVFIAPLQNNGFLSCKKVLASRDKPWKSLQQLLVHFHLRWVYLVKNIPWNKKRLIFQMRTLHPVKAQIWIIKRTLIITIWTICERKKFKKIKK